jgi:hypothetical protein
MSIETIALPRFYTIDGKVIDTTLETLKVADTLAQNIEDIRLDMAMLLARLGVPARFLNLVLTRSFINREDEPNESFLRLIRRFQTYYMAGIYQLCQYELILNGFNPADVVFDIVMPRHSWMSSKRVADVEVTRANTAAIWRSLMVPPDIVAKRFTDLNSQEIEAWQNALKNQVAPHD